MRQLLEVQGSLVASQGGSAKLTPQVAGRVAQVYVKEGDSVVAGQLLARVDVRVQSEQQASALAAAQAAEALTRQSQLGLRATAADQAANLVNANLALDAARLDRDTQVRQAQLAYQSALSDVARAKSQGQQAVVQARVARDHAQSDYDRNQRLYAVGFVALKDLEASKATLDTAQSALKAASDAAASDVKDAQLKATGAHDALAAVGSLGAKRVAQAQATVAQARAAEANVAAKGQEVETNRNLARQKQADLAAASETASLGEIRAPFSGKVVRRALNPGDSADTTTTVIEMVGSGAQPDFVGTLPADDAAKVRLGMVAQIGDSGGTVSSVSPADPQTGLCSVRIIGALHGTIGSFSTAQIVLRRDLQTVAVPKEALVDREGKTVVFRIDGDTAKMVEVATTAEDGGFVEVSGVKAGDQLVKVGQFELSDGAKVKIAAPQPEKE